MLIKQQQQRRRRDRGAEKEKGVRGERWEVSHRPDAKCRVNVIHAGYRLATQKKPPRRTTAARIRFEKIVRCTPALSDRPRARPIALPELRGREIKVRSGYCLLRDARPRYAVTPLPLLTHRWTPVFDAAERVGLSFFFPESQSSPPRLARRKLRGRFAPATIQAPAATREINHRHR